MQAVQDAAPGRLLAYPGRHAAKAVAFDEATAAPGGAGRHPWRPAVGAKLPAVQMTQDVALLSPEAEPGGQGSAILAEGEAT